MKKISYFIIVISILSFYGCSEKPNDTMFKIVKKQLDNDSCKINFKEIISQPWEELFIVDANITPTEISRAIGFNYSGSMVPDNEYRLIITKGKKILKEDTYFVSRLVFKDNDSNGIIRISVNDYFCAEFNATIEPNFYYLKIR